MVDAWCRNASARFRTRCAGEVVMSARRLHWLAGSGRGVGVREQARPTGGKGAVDRFTPSEAVGAEGWAALVAFADVADLVEIVGSTAELVVSVEVEVDSSGQWRQSNDQADLQDEEARTETRGPPSVLDSERSESRVAPPRQGNPTVPDENENELSSAGEDETAGSRAARNDSGDGKSSSETGNCEDGTVAAVLVEELEEQRHIHTVRSGAESDRANPRGDLPLRSNSKRVRATRLEAPTPGHSSTLGEAAESAAPLSRERRRSSSASTSSELVAINEEEDTDVDTCSDSEDGEQGGEDGRSNAEREPLPRGSLRAVDRSDAILVGNVRAESAGGGDKSDRETDGREYAGEVAVPKIPAATARARIILDPSTIEESLAVAPLSAFVLQAARRAHRVGFKTSVPDGVHHADGCGCSSSLDMHCATGALTSPEKAYKNVAERQGYPGAASLTDAESKQGRPVVCPATSTDQQRPHADDARKLPPKSPPAGRTSPGHEIPDIEKLGLACAVETLVLPRVRVSLTSKRRETPVSSDRRTVMRLRLDMPIDPSQRVSNPEGMTAAPPATQEPAAEAAEAAPSTGATAAATVRVPLSAGGTLGLEDKLRRTKRYIRNPVNRWVGRADGRRCLLSCSAAPSPSANARLAQLARAAGWQSGGRGINPNQHRGVEEGARCVSAIFVRVHAVDVDGVDGPSPLEKQQVKKQRFVVFDQIPSARLPPNPSTLDGSRRSGRRPLCRNCGRRALQRLRVNTNLLSHGNSTFLVPNGPPRADTDTRNHGWSEAWDDRVLQQLRFEAWQRRSRNSGAAGKVASPGRLADWACSSGAMLCNACLGLLRPAEAPLDRVMSVL